MSKKSIIIFSAIILILAAGGGFYAYKNGLISFGKKPENNIITPEKLLASFEIKNPNLSPEAVALFQQRFYETKNRLQADPTNFGDWLYWGVLKKGAGDYETARDVFIYAGQLRPQASTPFANLADLYAYFLNDPIKAEENMKKAIANDLNDYSLYLSLADIYRYKFSDGAAKYEQILLEAVVKFSDNANLIAPLAAHYRDTDQTQKAIEWYEKLVKLQPDNQEAKQDLAELKKIQ